MWKGPNVDMFGHTQEITIFPCRRIFLVNSVGIFPDTTTTTALHYEASLKPQARELAVDSFQVQVRL